MFPTEANAPKQERKLPFLGKYCVWKQIIVLTISNMNCFVNKILMLIRIFFSF